MLDVLGKLVAGGEDSQNPSSGMTYNDHNDNHINKTSQEKSLTPLKQEPVEVPNVIKDSPV